MANPASKRRPRSASGPTTASAPGRNSPLARLADFVHYVEHHAVFKRKLPPEVASMFEALAPYALRFREPPPFELVREKDGKVVFRGAAKLAHNGLEPDGKSNHSAENVYTLDFTGFADPGRYYLRVPGVGRSIAFDVAADVYLRPFRVQSAGVFAQRCGFELTPDHAPGWRRIACHTNGVVLTTVENWRKLSGMGPLRENPVR